jgi:hypothetical protein
MIELEELGIKPEDCFTITIDQRRFLCMTPQFLKNRELNGCAVILSACNSANRNMVDSFLANGAKIISGTLTTVDNAANIIYDDMLMTYLSHGLSFQAAYNYVLSSEKTQTALAALKEYWRINQIKVSDSSMDIPNNYRINATDLFFLRDPFPYDLQQSVNNNGVVFSWKCDLVSFPVEWKNHIKGNSWQYITYSYKILYDLYVNGSPVLTNLSEKQVSWTTEQSVDLESWYVVAKIMEGDLVLESFKSDVVGFSAEPEAVDLGLSVKWATCNLGATRPEEYGDYFAWAETAPKDDYSWGTYKWCMGDMYTMTKYCNNSYHGYNGFTDGKTVLDLEDDVAHVNLGGNWRIPTRAEWNELSANCTWTWIQENGINGGKLTSRINGNSIFLPAAGHMSNTDLFAAGSYGLYWCSILDTSPYNAKYIQFASHLFGTHNRARYNGFSIRPVCK